MAEQDDKPNLPAGYVLNQEGTGAAAVPAKEKASSPSLPPGYVLNPEKSAEPTPQSTGDKVKESFAPMHMLREAGGGLKDLGKSTLEFGADVLTNPDWVIGQGKTFKEKIFDPNTTFNKFIYSPTAVEHQKASDMWDELKNQSRTTGRAPMEKIVEMGGHELASLVPIFGPWAANLGEQAGTGDVGGAVARGGSQALALKLVKPALGKLGEKTGITPVLNKIGEKIPSAETVGNFAGRNIVGPTMNLFSKPEPPPEPAGIPRGNPTPFTPAPAGEAVKPMVPPAAPIETSTTKSLRTIDDLINQITGVKPLEPNVPLKEQIPTLNKPTNAPPVTVEDPIKAKYPDSAVRQMVRANGEDVVDAVGEDKALMKQIHDLKNVDVRQAAINGDIDVGQKHVGSKGALGEAQISRQEILSQLIRKGYSPADIVRLAKPPAK